MVDDDLFDDSAFPFEFMGADNEFRTTLEAAFPEVDIVARSSFGGTEILAVVGNVSKAFIGALASFLLQKKKADAGRAITIKTGRDKEIRLEGFGGDDIKSMEAALVNLIREQKK